MVRRPSAHMTLSRRERRRAELAWRRDRTRARWRELVHIITGKCPQCRVRNGHKMDCTYTY